MVFLLPKENGTLAHNQTIFGVSPFWPEGGAAVVVLKYVCVWMWLGEPVWREVATAVFRKQMEHFSASSGSVCTGTWLVPHSTYSTTGDNFILRSLGVWFAWSAMNLQEIDQTRGYQ